MRIVFATRAVIMVGGARFVSKAIPMMGANSATITVTIEKATDDDIAFAVEGGNDLVNWSQVGASAVTIGPGVLTFTRSGVGARWIRIIGDALAGVPGDTAIFSGVLETKKR
jgi:hypothetical protein